MSDDGLPWETAPQDDTVGVCLSGGGIRAAAFALGAVQALQRERRLFFGPKPADYLAAVSGGSYVAATATLNAAGLARADAMPPLAEDSPEAAHIVASGGYMKNWLPGRRLDRILGWPMLALVFVVFALVNLMGFVTIFAWTGAMLVGAGSIGGSALAVSSRWPGLPLGLGGLLIGGRLLVRGRYMYSYRAGIVRAVTGLAIVCLSAPSLIARHEDFESALEWLWDAMRGDWHLALAAVLAYGVLASVPIPWRPLRGLVALLVGSVPRILGLALLMLSITLAGGEDEDTAAATFLVGVFGAGVSAVLLSRVSLHRLNRSRISMCFAVRRTPTGVEKVDGAKTRLSSLNPHEAKPGCGFPQLLICATANVLRRDSAGRRRTFEPFIFSHDRSGLSGARNASFATADLEEGRRASGLCSWSERVLSLMTAVAAAGAAVTPSMGNKTRPGLRSAIALLNLRMGTWMPNPLCGHIRREVAGGAGWWMPKKWFMPPKHQAIGGGYDEFVPELFGAHQSDAPRVYVSDGGHYDNLGLLALLRARCRMIWCVDSEADPRGKARQLRQVCDLATQEGIVDGIEISPSRFKGSDGRIGRGHVVGDIAYADGSEGKLVVIKLGLTDASCEDLKLYSAKDRRWMGPGRKVLASLPGLWAVFSRFPFDHTFVHIAFDPRRMDAYRRLGAENAARATRDPQARIPGVSASAPSAPPRCRRSAGG